MIFIKLIVSIFLFLLNFFALTQKVEVLPLNIAVEKPPIVKPYFTEINNIWVDSVFNNLSLDQKIGQLFIVAAYSNQSENEYDRIESLIKRYHLGGLIFMQGTPKVQARLTNRYQKASKTPLLISIDGEWGLGMRLSNVISYPKAVTLGAIQNDTLIYKMAAHIAEQCKRLGVHLDFAPDSDVNSNSENPVIGYRSFGDNKFNVAKKSIAYMKGLQHNRVMANAKHFPGHGDTNTDSHYNLPKINHTIERLTDVDLYPFSQLIGDSIMSVITGHLLVPSIENKNIASSLSKKVVADLLKNQMGFRGLVITDALNMKGATKNGNSAGDIELQAFMAGNDLLLMPENAIAGINKIKAAVANGKIDIGDLNQRVKKIIQAKYWAGLHLKTTVDENYLTEDLNQKKYLGLRQTLFENAVTVASNNDQLIPLNNKTSPKVVSIAIGADLGNSFQKMLLKFGSFPIYANESRSDDKWYANMLDKIDTGKTVVVSLHKMSNYPSRRYGISPTTLNFLTKLQKRNKVLLVVFGNPYSLKYFPEIGNLVCAFEDDPQMQEAAAQVVFGAINAKGHLPVAVGNRFKEGDGLSINSRNILGYSLPEAVGINSIALERIDNIVNNAISQKILPGCNMLIARNGKVAYTKTYGNLKYESAQKVTQHTVYDLASVTKVAATLQAIMKLTDAGLLSMEEKASFYLSELDSTNKQNITIGNLLRHQAGLQGYIPFWEYTKANRELSSKYYNTTKSESFPFTVANGIYGNQALKDSLWNWVVASPMLSKKGSDGEYRFLYSDLGLLILQKVVERITGMPLNEYCEKSFYKPLALERTGFNILDKISVDQIAPTEYDRAFRGIQISGTVQDQQAAMMGGVAGHAGLFGSLNDLAKIMQMNLNNGIYDGLRYLNDETLNRFTRYSSSKSHRALGWDKQPDDHDSNYISGEASLSSYGHSGYTGTMVWVDPKYDLIFIFLANRIYPNANNNKLNSLKIRRKIHDVVYQSLIK